MVSELLANGVPILIGSVYLIAWIYLIYVNVRGG